MLASFEHYVDDVGLSLNLPEIFVQHCATFFASSCCTMLASFVFITRLVHVYWHVMSDQLVLRIKCICLALVCLS